MKYIITISILIWSNVVFGQHSDYIGAGNVDGIIVSTSSNLAGTDPMHTIDGSGMDADRMEAARFLTQSTMGFTEAEIDQVVDMGFEGWLDDQVTIPASSTVDAVGPIWQNLQDIYHAAGEDTTTTFGPYSIHFNYAWWENHMTKDDLLRQRVAWALSQIFVVSTNSDLRDDAIRLAAYYDMLADNAFGNYRDLLEDVTLHVSMGFYLSHLNNPKTDLALNIRPDENFAREIMQLFSIGLYNLNNDGTPIVNANGENIATYDNDDIKELAKVFTGLYPGAINSNVTWTNQPYFGLGIWGADPRVPMQMSQSDHEPGQKILLKNKIIPAGQAGMTDIEMALDTLFMHPNVGPFISIRLIQRLVKSNPTPAYVDRVATVFNDNGNGVRGDLEAVIKAILLDPEARTCTALQDPDAGRMTEPFFRFTHLAKAIGLDSLEGGFYNNGERLRNDVGQHLLSSPTVFNFYTFDHVPVGPLSEENLVGPEFNLLNTSTVTSYFNEVNAWAVWSYPWWNYNGDYNITDPRFLFWDLHPMTESPDELLDKLDVLLTHGSMTDETREDIRQAMFNQQWGNYQQSRAQIALYLLLISPDFVISR